MKFKNIKPNRLTSRVVNIKKNFYLNSNLYRKENSKKYLEYLIGVFKQRKKELGENYEPM